MLFHGVKVHVTLIKVHTTLDKVYATLSKMHTKLFATVATLATVR